MEKSEWKVGPSTFKASPEAGYRLYSWELELAGGVKRSLFSAPVSIKIPFIENSTLELSPTLKSATDTHLTVEYSLEGGPVTIEYAFEALSITTNIEVHNTRLESINCCPGVTYSIKTPWHEDLGLESYEVRSSAKKVFQADQSHKLLTYKDFHEIQGLEDRRLRSLWHMKHKENRVVLGPKGGEEGVSIELGEEPIPGIWSGVRYWHDGENTLYMDAVAGPPGAVVNKKGVHSVLPGQSRKFIFRLGLD